MAKSTKSAPCHHLGANCHGAMSQNADASMAVAVHGSMGVCRTASHTMTFAARIGWVEPEVPRQLVLAVSCCVRFSHALVYCMGFLPSGNM